MNREHPLIVVVEDDPQLRKAIFESLTAHGYEVKATHNGKQALAIIQEQKPELVISDLLIPGLHGLELCAQIKSSPLTSNTKVALMTAVYKKQRYQIEANQQGADLFLVKPLDIEALPLQVKHLISGTKPKTQSRLGEKLKKLKAKFARNIPSRIEKMEQHWTAVKQRRAHRAWDAFFKAVHELAGSGQTFGFERLSSIAAEIEQTLIPIRKLDRFPNPEEQTLIDQQLSAMKTANERLAETAKGTRD